MPQKKIWNCEKCGIELQWGEIAGKGWRPVLTSDGTTQHLSQFCKGQNVEGPKPANNQALITEQKSTAEVPKVKEIMSKEQLDSQQLQRIENKLDAIIKHFKIDFQQNKEDLIPI